MTLTNTVREYDAHVRAWELHRVNEALGRIQYPSSVVVRIGVVK